MFQANSKPCAEQDQMRAPLRTPFVCVIIYVFAGDYNMSVFCVLLCFS